MTTKGDPQKKKWLSESGLCFGVGKTGKHTFLSYLEFKKHATYGANQLS